MSHTSIDLQLTAEDYQHAIDAQVACNLSAIVTCMGEIVPKIWREARKRGFGTDWVNQHPICRLFAEQIWFLTGAASNVSSYRHAFEEASRVAQQLREQQDELLDDFSDFVYIDGDENDYGDSTGLQQDDDTVPTTYSEWFDL